MQTKRRRVSDSDEPAIIALIDLPKDLTPKDIEYFIQKDYNIESRFFEPNFLELCMYYILSLMIKIVSINNNYSIQQETMQ